MSKLVIRKMQITDVDAVLNVEKASFTSPWCKNIFYQELMDNEHAHYFVSIVNKNIIGYAGLWIVRDNAQVTNISIHPNYRGYKYSEKLFHYIFYYAIKHGAARLSLEVRLSNIAAQHMYRKFGLVPGGIRKRYYQDNNEDALIMWVNIK